MNSMHVKNTSFNDEQKTVGLLFPQILNIWLQLTADIKFIKL